MKKYAVTAVVAVFLVLLTLGIFASEEPKVTSDAIGYIDFTNGKDTNDGFSAATAKKAIGQPNGKSVVSLVKNGGTIVVCGKMYVALEYSMNKLGGTLLITSNDGVTDYKNFEPVQNPDCAFKMATGVTFTVSQDTIFDDIILFQEASTSNTISVSGGATLVIGEKVATVPSPKTSDPCYMTLNVERGSTLIVKAGTFQNITGGGTVILDDDVTIINQQEKPEVTDKDSVANALYFLGLVKGYDDRGGDFKLANKLTRAESIVQIVRFLGAEKEALGGEYTVPFTDVPEWAVPYIGYAYANGITSGRSATKFDTNGTVDEAQFLTLLLRAMDYSDKDGDFVWSNPFALANSVGLTAHTAAEENYTRGDAFTACCNALSSKCKTGKTVAEKLIAENVITEKSYGYAKRILAGETIVVACVGDSLTQGTGSTIAAEYSYPAQLKKLLGKGFEVVNCGKASSYVMNLDSQYNVKKTSPNLWYPNTAEYSKLRVSYPDIIIVILGTNDARSMTEPKAVEDFASSYKALIADFKTFGDNPEIYLSSMIPAVNADITYDGTVHVLPEAIENIANELKLPFIPTHKALHNYYCVMLNSNDKIHPDNESYPALAINFYNEVFGGNADLPELPLAKDDVIYVSGSGNAKNGGTSAEDAVNSIGLAVAMLRENGGTVVVCERIGFSETHLIACGGSVKITSVYGGVDYRETKNARLLPSGSLTLASDIVLDDINIQTTAAGKSINCNYNNLTIGSGVNCSGVGDMAINVGHRIGAGATPKEAVSCNEDCTVNVAGGKWSIIRGGNMRTSGTNPIGNVAKGVKLTINISGGMFTYVGANANTAVGMNSCDGDVYFNISGGTFAGGVYGLSRIGTNSTDTHPEFKGNLSMSITGGEFKGEVGLYQNDDTPSVEGTATISVTNALKSFVKLEEFNKKNFID